MLRSGNDAEALGTHSTSVADVRKKYKEAATMLHPDKQHGAGCGGAAQDGDGVAARVRGIR